MATRSTISLELEDKKVKTIFCFLDGYVKDGVGEILVKHYNTEEKIQKLLSLGDLSILSERLAPNEGEQHSYDKPIKGVTVAYKRDREETDVDSVVYPNFKKAQKEEFNYLFRDGKWYFTELDYEYQFETELKEVIID